MDAFRLAAEMKAHHYNMIETTKHVQVCKLKSVPKDERELSFATTIKQKHIHQGIALVLHNINGEQVLEVRGFDENKQEFSYKFHYEVGQPLCFRAIDAGGSAIKLIPKPAKKAEGMQIIEK
jgi:hypothetical protein